MPRFVILRHDAPPGGTQTRHWDLMLEVGDSLRTWAMEEEPRAGVPIGARSLPDHRPAYLQYEGPLSQDRGHVRRWDEGIYRELDKTDTSLRFSLQGQRLCGALTLACSEEDPQRWTVTFSSR